MIKLTRIVDYGILVMTELARRDACVPASELAAGSRVSAPLVAKVLKKLARAGLVKSERGSRGGYRLGRPASAISLGAIVGAPVVEELIFRMGIQSGALAFCKRPAVAVALSTAIFVLVHVGPGTFAAAPDAAAPLQAQPAAQQAQPAGVFWTALPALAVLGWILGVTYERTRSIFVPILVHMGFNAVNIAGAVLLTAAGNSGPGTP